MVDDDKRQSGDKDGKHGGYSEPHVAPAPWERAQKQQGQLRHDLAGGAEYTADEGDQATYLADDQQSLQSKIGGGGRDRGDEAGSEATRLCPACGAVTRFVQGVCSSCGYKQGTAVVPPGRGMGAPTYISGGTSPGVRIVIFILVVAVVITAVVFWYIKSRPQTDEQSTETLPAGTAETGTAATATPVTEGDATHPGGLSQVTIDDAFRESLRTALEQGNTAWANAGVDCYVYRYSLFEQVEAATSQTVNATCYVGGKDAELASKVPGNEPFQKAVASFLDSLNARSGVDANIILQYTDGAETPGASDVYIRYGYMYGKEHIAEIQPIIDALEQEKKATGEYPHAIAETIVQPKIRTYGGITFITKGFGYIPIYKTDGSGHIIMGTGSGIESFYPEECTGYLLVKFTEAEKYGLDLFSTADFLYYKDHIAPFPYSPKDPVTNMPLNPDGKPDGIGCVVKNGELQDN